MGRTRSRGTEMSQPATGPKREQGQIIVLFVFALVVIMGFAAIVIDVGVLRNANQNLWNALDAGALAGASQLPADASNANAIAMDYANRNYPGGLPPGVSVGFRCVIGSSGGSPRLSDVPAVCDPGPNAAWTCNSTICQSQCVPAEGDTCNTIVLEGDVTVPYRFGPAVGLDSGTSQTVISAACKGPCGAKPVDAGRPRARRRPDVEHERDRHRERPRRGRCGPQGLQPGGAVDGPRDARPEPYLGRLRDRARRLDRNGQPARPTCAAGSPIGLSGHRRPDQRELRRRRQRHGRAIGCYTNSSIGTDLADPVTAAAWELVQSGRPGVTKGIILETDGQPNNSTIPTGSNAYCAQSYAAAVAAKNQGIELFTIGFGLDGSNNATCPDTTGPWQGVRATTLLAAMATDSVDAGCPGNSNDDGDHFFCLPKSSGRQHEPVGAVQAGGERARRGDEAHPAALGATIAGRGTGEGPAGRRRDPATIAGQLVGAAGRMRTSNASYPEPDGVPRTAANAPTLSASAVAG